MPPYDDFFTTKYDFRYKPLFPQSLPPLFPQSIPLCLKTDSEIEAEKKRLNSDLRSLNLAATDVRTELRELRDEVRELEAEQRSIAQKQSVKQGALNKLTAEQTAREKSRAALKVVTEKLNAEFRRDALRQRFGGTLLVTDTCGQQYLVKNVDLDTVKEGKDIASIWQPGAVATFSSNTYKQVGSTKPLVPQTLPGLFVAKSFEKVCG